MFVLIVNAKQNVSVVKICFHLHQTETKTFTTVFLINFLTVKTYVYTVVCVAFNISYGLVFIIRQVIYQPCLCW